MLLASRLTALTSLPSRCLSFDRSLPADSANAWRRQATTKRKEKLQTTKRITLKCNIPTTSLILPHSFKIQACLVLKTKLIKTDRVDRWVEAVWQHTEPSIEGAHLVQKYSPDGTIFVIKECLHVFILKYMHKVEISHWNRASISNIFIYDLNKMYPKVFSLQIF